MRSVATAATPLMQFLSDPEPYVTETGTSSGELLRVTRVANSNCAMYFDRVTITRRNQALEKRFQQLAEQWSADMSFESSAERMTEHPAYRAIVNLGEDAVPLLLRELEAEPKFWFSALREITGANPVTEADRGHLDRMSQVWLQWGRQQGYSW